MKYAPLLTCVHSQHVPFYTNLQHHIALWKSQYLAAIQILREIIFGNFLVPQNYRCDRILAA